MRTDSIRQAAKQRLSSRRCGIALLLVIGLLANPMLAAAAAPDDRAAPEHYYTLGGADTQDQRGIDWASAAIGAGAVLSIVAIGGAVLLTVRRRVPGGRRLAVPPERDPGAGR